MFDIKAEETAVLLIDVQERLLPVIHESEKLITNCIKSLRAAELLGLQRYCTEQYPRGLGHTEGRLQDEISGVAIYEKTAFSSFGAAGLKAALEQQKTKNLILIGIETQVCVFQTALSALAENYQVFILADAVSSRQALDKEIALQNLRHSGCTVTTFECLFMGLLKDAAHPDFKKMSAILKLG